MSVCVTCAAGCGERFADEHAGGRHVGRGHAGAGEREVVVGAVVEVARVVRYRAHHVATGRGEDALVPLAETAERAVFVERSNGHDVAAGRRIGEAGLLVVFDERIAGGDGDEDAVGFEQCEFVFDDRPLGRTVGIPTRRAIG